MKLAVLSAARSGTAYMATVLRLAGLRTGHESVFTHADVLGHLAGGAPVPLSPAYQADVSWMAAASLSRAPAADLALVHQVRHPRRVVESMLGVGHLFRPHLTYDGICYAAHPELEDVEGRQERVVQHYLRWNAMIEALPVAFRYRVESLDLRTLDRILDLAGEGPGFARERRAALAAVPPTLNRRIRGKLDPSILEPATFVALGEVCVRYGYRWEGGLV